MGLYAPLPFLCLVLLLTRQHRALLLLCLPLAVFVFKYGQLFIPQPTESGPTLRLMSWNLLYNNENMHGIVHAIEREKPDIIAVQELARPQSYALSKSLEAQYPYQLLRPSDDTSGLGIFSRFPITEGFPAKLSGPHCRCQHAFITINSQTIEIINVHPHIPHIYTSSIRSFKLPIGIDSATQRDTFEELVKRIKLRKLPLLVLGDLNTTERQQSYIELSEHLDDAFREAGWGLGLTYPQNYRLRQVPIPAFMRLDYILYSQEWSANAAWINTATGSDHAYVVAELVLHLVGPFNGNKHIFANDRDRVGGDANTYWRNNSLTSAYAICPAMPGTAHHIAYQYPRRQRATLMAANVTKGM